MTETQRRQLLKELSARLPYGVIVKNDKLGIEGKLLTVSNYQPACGYILTDIASGNQEYTLIEDVKPYLRPMSSMTEDEKLHVEVDYSFFYNDGVFENIDIFETGGYYDRDGNYNERITQRATLHVTMNDVLNLINWLNEHHFDYRGLIPMGLALEALEDMYN